MYRTPFYTTACKHSQGDFDMRSAFDTTVSEHHAGAVHASRAASLQQPLPGAAVSASRAASLQQPLPAVSVNASNTPSLQMPTSPNRKPAEPANATGMQMDKADKQAAVPRVATNAAEPSVPVQPAAQQSQAASVQQSAKQPRRVAKAPVAVAPPALSPAQQLQQHLQHYRASMQAENVPHMRPGALPLSYAGCNLTQPGPRFIPGFAATSLDASTALPEKSNNSTADAAAAAAAQIQVGMWKCTTWGWQTGTAQVSVL